DQTRGQNFLGGGAAFALDKAAGKLARGVGLFAVIDGKREEIAAGDYVAFHSCREDHRIAIANDDRPMGLLGELAGFQTKRTFSQLPFDSTCLHGMILILPAGAACFWEADASPPKRQTGGLAARSSRELVPTFANPTDR